MELTVNDKLTQFINNLEPEFIRVQSNNDISFDQEAYFAVQLLMKGGSPSNPSYLYKMAQANPQSLRSAVVNVATIGLTLNPALGFAYLVPRKNEICLDISYLGLVKLAQDSGSVKDIKADIVYEKDVFEITGQFTLPEHKYKPFEDRGKILGAYVTALTASGSYLTTVMPIDEIYSIRDMSESYKNPKTRGYSPWFKFETEMIKKTVIRRAYKSWPKGERMVVLEKAIEVSDDAQAIEFRSQHQIEQDEIDKDFPIPENEKEIGSPEYRIQHAKYRGKQLQDISKQELEEYLETLEKRHKSTTAKAWELEVKASINYYLEDLEYNQMENTDN